MSLEARIEALATKATQGMGIEIVRVSLSKDRRPKMLVTIDRLDGTSITIEDCVSVSDALSLVLDTEDPVSGSYILEVSSPGEDRPLTKPDHFKRFSGVTISLELKEINQDGRRRYRGLLKEALDADLLLEYEGKEGALETIRVGYPEIRRANVASRPERVRPGQREAAKKEGLGQAKKRKEKQKE